MGRNLLSHSSGARVASASAGILCLALALTALAQAPAAEPAPASAPAYTDIETDLGAGLALQEVADRAYDHADDYWASKAAARDGTDDELSAGEAVTAIFTHAAERPAADAIARDIIEVTVAVVESWPDCEDTFDAVRAAVAQAPDRADEIVATIAVKRDCNCHNGGLWLDQRVDERLRVEMRHDILDVPFQCSCSQVAMYAGIAGLPENRAWNDQLPEAEKQALIASLTEKVTVITERTAALQSLNSWECGCTDVNIAASMQGIEAEELRDGAYEGLATRYSEEAGDSGLVVDALGMVGTYPAGFWGSGEATTRDNDLRRKGEIYRGDNLILDPFDPATQYGGFGDRNFADLGLHQYSAASIPTDVFISEYLEGWNEAALQQPEAERDPEQRNRVLELYNGSDETIDLGADQYFLEIYAGPGTPTRSVAAPPALVRRTISLQSDVTFDFDKSDIRAEASADLQQVIKTLNEAEIFSELLISGHTCDMGSDEYNLGLSERRADSVRDYLQQNGLKDVAIRTEGLGEAQPRLPNDSKANRSRNRRVDITFVTREGAEIEKTVTQADPAGPRKIDITFLAPIPASVHAVESEAAGGMAAGEYSEGDMKPRQVIGLNGAVDPGATFVVAFSESDDLVKERAQLVTGQLDFKPNETLVLRRLGGEMALNCRAQAWSYVTNFPPVPFIRDPDPDPPPPPPPDLASPN